MQRKFLFTLLAIDLLLIVLHIAFGTRFDLLNLDRERTPGAYWSGLQLLAVAALAVGMIVLSLTRVRRFLWGVFAFLFMGFGFDEISELHENITYYISTYLHIPIPTIFRSTTYNWLIILSPLILFVFVFFFSFIKTLYQENQRSLQLLVLGFSLFLAAMLVELVNGLDASQQFYNALVVLEEGLELFGESFAFLGMFRIASDHFDRQYARRV